MGLGIIILTIISIYLGILPISALRELEEILSQTSLISRVPLLKQVTCSVYKHTPGLRFNQCPAGNWWAPDWLFLIKLRLRSNYTEGTSSPPLLQMMLETRPVFPVHSGYMWTCLLNLSGLWRNKFPITQCVILQIKTSVFKHLCLKGIHKAINCANYKELITPCAIWRAPKKIARLAESKKSWWPGCCLKPCRHFWSEAARDETELVSVTSHENEYWPNHLGFNRPAINPHYPLTSQDWLCNNLADPFSLSHTHFDIY